MSMEGSEGNGCKTSGLMWTFDPHASPVGPIGESPSPWKDTNPKTAFADKKLPLDTVPASLEEYCALALLEGALKYGRYNWRISGVSVSTYIGALKRHINDYWEGQWADPITKVPHLANALACLAIIIDANQCGTLNDDRPPSVPEHDLWVDAQSEIVEHLKELFKDKHPKQYTIADTPRREAVALNAEESCPQK